MPRSRHDRTTSTARSGASSDPIVLSGHGLTSGYSGSTVINNLSLDLERGTTTAIVGPNGVGKSTLLRTLMGIVAARRGEIRLGGSRLNGLSPSRRTRRGLVLCPEGRGLFPNLTVEENLRLGIVAGGGSVRSDSFDRVYEVFPVLRDRRTQRASTMSGGEQQMVAVARSLLSRPKVLLLDEPSLGLAIGAVEALAHTLAKLQSDDGLTILLVEQDPTLPALIAHRVLPMTNGQLTEATSLAEAKANALGAFFDRALNALSKSPR